MDNKVPRLTKEQAVIVSAFSGTCCAEFSDVHQKIEQLLGRPVWTHELADKAVWAQVKEAVKDEFISICPEEASRG